MTKRIRFLGWATSWVAFVTAAVWVTAAVPQPNVVIVITDDQGYPNLSHTGHPMLQTPNIDRLAQRAVRLTNYHVDPTCAPTRSALMTGRYSDRVGVWHTIMGRSLLRVREVTMADVFKASGYATGHFGKWHLGDNYPFRPQDRGFDYVVRHGGGGIWQTPDFWGNDYFDDVFEVNGTAVQFKGFCTDVFFDEAMQFIQRSVAARKRFFCYITTNAPHGPFYAPDRNTERLKARGLKLKPQTLHYYGMIENIDDNMGRLRDFLRDQGVLENTLLVFTSDNGAVTQEGLAIHNAGLRAGKGSRYDGGHRVPWIMSWPAGGLDEGTDIDRVTAHIDILPTFIEMCGLQNPGVEFDGMSLNPILKNPRADWPERRLVVESQRVRDPIKYRNFAVMTDRWRLTGTQDERFELYDVTLDRGQKTDLSEENPSTSQELLAAYGRFWSDVSREHDLMSRTVIGSEHQNPTQLTSHDWLGRTLWNQDQIRKPAAKPKDLLGAWAVEVEQDGWYQISLRRWPAEVDKAIADPYLGTGFDVTTAGLTIQGQELERPIPSGASEVTFRVKLKRGATELETRFSGGDRDISAFYAYVLREEGAVREGWQTREGLGLPVAVWPEQHGRDPSGVTQN